MSSANGRTSARASTASRRSLGADLARVSGSGSPPLAELLAARAQLQAELDTREDALQFAQRMMWESQSAAAAAVRADAEAALEQANRQVRSLAKALQTAVKAQDAAQAEQRAAAARAKAAEEEAAALRAEVLLLRAKVAKLTRPATPDAVGHSRASAPVTAERAAMSRLQREMELLRATAARTSREEKRVSSTAPAGAADPALCRLVQELARAEADARAQLAASQEEAHVLRERLAEAERHTAAMANALGHYAVQAEPPGAEVTLAQLAAPDTHATRLASALRAAQWVDPSPELEAEDNKATPFEVYAAEAHALPHVQEAPVAAVQLSESPATLVSQPAPPAVVAAADAVFSPAELSGDDEAEDDSEVGPSDVARAQAALELAEAEAAQLAQAEKSLRQRQEQAEADYAYASEAVERAMAAVSEADAALSTGRNPVQLQDLSVVRTRAVQEATRAEESARISASAVRAAAAAAAAATEAAAVARATVTAKAFTAAQLAAVDRRNADFRAKLQAVQAQTASLAKQLQSEAAACGRVRNEATALMAVLAASGRPELVEDATSRAAELESISDEENAVETPAQQPKGWQERIHSAARDRDRLTNTLAAERARKRAADALVSVLSERLELLKTARASAGGSGRPPLPPTSSQTASLFGRMRR